ncbi:MAG TPA: hypothetical protein PKW50_02855 [Syntrophomonas sp.]|nr:hypothetical protein [Syntrophomonas sp.]
MADAIVRGEIDGINDAEFRTSLTCSRGVPTGSIRGEIEIRANRRDIDYTFRSTNPTRIIARRYGITRYVYVVFSQVTLRNQRTGFTISNARIVLTARKLANGRRQATLLIFRPGRTTLRASGILEDGRIFVARNVSCQLLLQ